MHATLLRSEPARDSTVATPPRIYLVFSEEVEPSLGGIRLVGPGGQIVSLKTAGDPRNVSALVAPLSAPLTPGIWRVEWRIVSEDGHPIDGDFGFTVAGSAGAVAGATASVPDEALDTASSAPSARTVPSDSAAAPARSASAMEDVPVPAATLRGLGIGSLTALLGLLGFLGTRRDKAPQPRADRLASALAIATAVLLGLHLVVWTLAVSPDRSLGGDQIGAMLASRVGRMEVARSALAILASWALVIARRHRLAIAFAVGAVLVSSATGHSAAIHPAWTIPSRALHLFAVAAWLGGLLWLLTLQRSSIDVVVSEAQRVSSLALAAVIAVSITGLVQTKFFIGEWGELVRSTYGFVALAKIAGLGVLVLFGAHHRFRVMPRLAEAGVADRFSRSLRTELAVLSLVILVGGLLAYIPPPQP
ncbi:MAG TPA: copper resistance protein CopC [Gemmatimonadaceae bacterium]|nr:copper resistance protein CopC [Gemmatimonadaceae bacterium]